MSLLLIHIVVLMTVLVAHGSAQRGDWRLRPVQQFTSVRRTTPVPTPTPTPLPEPPLVLHTTRILKLIWDNRGSAAEEPCSIWRAETKGSTYPVGDVVSKSLTDHSFTYLVHMPDPRNPVSYTKIWNDAGSGAVSDVTIWRVNCPQGYVALGNVATDGSDPSEGSIYCVNGKYALLGQKTDWEPAWNNKGGSAADPVAIYNAVPSTRYQQTVHGIGAITSYDGFPGSPYFLNKNFVNVNNDN